MSSSPSGNYSEKKNKYRLLFNLILEKIENVRKTNPELAVQMASILDKRLKDLEEETQKCSSSISFYLKNDRIETEPMIIDSEKQEESVSNT